MEKNKPGNVTRCRACNRCPAYGLLQTNLAGGSDTVKDVDTFFCEDGYYTPLMKPGSERCMRVNRVIPDNPSLVVVSWLTSGGELAGLSINPGRILLLTL